MFVRDLTRNSDIEKTPIRIWPNNRGLEQVCDTIRGMGVSNA